MPNLSAWQIREATEHDVSDIRELLTVSALPSEDIESSRPTFVVAIEDSIIVGVGGFERFGLTGLLRSIAVRASHRRNGLGRALLRDLEQRAHMAGMNEFVLLTETARTFFERQGYGVIERDAAPLPVQQSAEFRTLCPQSACCMSKPLRVDKFRAVARVPNPCPD